ncbi:N-acetyltransferase [Altererythrobacter sp.]|uniref:N-acetyltransferase n=1 Tax=Altererythrobacter sp. TaxID=1872480 RepID=UPI001B2D8993|nr:N-acetyltransferase [Altererythrobacter sp.]MBO6610170.1 N-acetyltransferase [Altererythrobacter sp.]MBO6642759.1 N-acetyltransferase [Altererythrobacter sp.]MBO6708733.1 N-acetyltransferase [Altererythrobacter sp.]
MSTHDIVIEQVSDKKGRAAFVDIGNMFAAREPHWVPQLRSEQIELITPDKNPFFGHAKAQLMIAWRQGKPVGRISAHIDKLALDMPREQGFGPGTGMFGYFDAEDEAVAHVLLAEAERWLRSEEMERVLGPISMSIWEEPGLLVRGQDHSPMIMMGHHPAQYRSWIESYGFEPAKTLLTYDLDVSRDFPPLIQRIVKSGERNDRISVRQVVKKDWDAEVDIILSILNDAWSSNWGFVPFTPEEIAHAGKKLRPIIFEPLNMIAELDGEPVAFMLTFPDINQVLKKTDGKLFPFGWFHLLRWLRNPKDAGMRVPLMGVKKELHNSRVASQLAFMMISHIRKNASALYGSQRGEIGWILDDNQGMVAIADAIESKINREYIVFSKSLS